MTARLLRRALQTAADLGMAWVLTVAAFGSADAYPEVLLAVKLNVFALPLAVADVLAFPWWVWYVIGVLWLSQLLYYGRMTVADVAQVVRTRLQDSTISLADPADGPVGGQEAD